MDKEYKGIISKDMIIIALFILCGGLLIININLTISWNELSQLYIDNCYMEPAKQAINYTVRWNG